MIYRAHAGGFKVLERALSTRPCNQKTFARARAKVNKSEVSLEVWSVKGDVATTL